jgi:hypothetical protein
MPLIDVLLQRWDRFLGNLQPVRTASKSYRMETLPLNNTPPKRAIPLFGADSGFGEDWSYLTAPEIKGPATTPQPVQSELKIVDDDVERWKGPNPDVPSLTPHGKTLDYSRNTDQQPVRSFSGEISDVWDGQIRNVVQRQGFQSVREKSELTPGDRAAEELRHYPYDFT